MHKIIIMILAFALLLAACNGAAPQSSSGSAAQSSSGAASQSGSDAGETPVSEETIKLRVGILQGYQLPDSQIEKHFEELHNVEIELIPYPGWTDGQTKISMLMADDTQRPDIVWWWGMNNEYVQWVEAGLLVDLTDYMDKYTNIRDYYNSMDPKTLYFTSYSDGRIYRVPGDVSEPSCENIWIRKDWLRNLGLDEPKTMDEYIEVLRAFTEDDPDGNGVNDTFGLGGDGYDWRCFWPFIQGPGDTRYSSWITRPDGSVQYGPTTENTKIWLAQVADLYAKGYITPNIVTDTDREEEMAKGGFGSAYSWIAWNNEGAYTGITSYKASNPDSDWGMIDMVAGANGNPQENPTSSSAWCYVGITNVCPDPERAFALIDDMCSSENSIYRMYGEEGTHYVMEEGVYKPIIAGTSPENEAQNIGLGLFSCFAQRKDNALIANNPVTTARFEYAIANSRDSAATIVEWKNSADFKTWAQYGSDIEDEKNAYMWGVVAGTRSLDEWDNFIATLNSLGLDECTAEANAMYATQNADMEAYFASQS